MSGVLLNSFIHGGAAPPSGSGASLENDTSATPTTMTGLSIDVSSWGIQRGDFLIAYRTGDLDITADTLDGDWYNLRYKGYQQMTCHLQALECKGTETTVTGTGSTSDGICVVLLHYRGIRKPRRQHAVWIDQVTGMPRAPGIDTAGLYSNVIFGGLDDDNITATAPAGYTLLEATGHTNGSFTSSIMVAHKDTLSGLETPAAFGGAGSDYYQAISLGIYEETFPDDTGITPNLTLWLDASDETTLYTDAGTTAVTTDGDSVYQWNDKSGNGNHLLQATAANRPTYQTLEQGGIFDDDNVLSIVRFDGTNDVLQKAAVDYSSLYGANTIHGFAVVKQDSTSTINPLLYHGSGSTNKLHVNTDDTGNVECHFPDETGGSLSAAAPTYWDDNMRLVEFWRDGADGDLLVSDASIASSAALTGSASHTGQTVNLGSDGTNYFKGDVMEVLIFDDALSAGNQAAMVAYLKNKWRVEAGTFTPLDVGLPTIWLDADDLDTLFTEDFANTKCASDADDVGYWRCKATGLSPYNKIASQAGTYKTAIHNGLDTVRFNGTADKLRTDFEPYEAYSQAQECELFIVAMPEGSAATDDLFTTGSTTSNTISIQSTTTNVIFKHVNSTISATQPVGWFNNLHVINAWRSGANADLLVDGTSLGTSSGFTGSLNATNVDVSVACSQSGGNQFDGDICEIILYRGQLTSDERTRVKSYLATKWGVTVA